MAAAVANRPVEQFETQVPIPDWQLTPEEQMFGDVALDANALQSLVDENGMPLNDPNAPQQLPGDQPFVQPGRPGDPSQQELDQAFPPQQQPRANQFPQRPPPPQQQDPRSEPPADPTDPGTEAT
jgi:penicillin-binding protein 1A